MMNNDKIYWLVRECWKSMKNARERRALVARLILRPSCIVQCSFLEPPLGPTCLAPAPGITPLLKQLAILRQFRIECDWRWWERTRDSSVWLCDSSVWLMWLSTIYRSRLYSANYQLLNQNIEKRKTATFCHFWYISQLVGHHNFRTTSSLLHTTSSSSSSSKPCNRASQLLRSIVYTSVYYLYSSTQGRLHTIQQFADNDQSSSLTHTLHNYTTSEITACNVLCCSI